MVCGRGGGCGWFDSALLLRPDPTHRLPLRQSFLALVLTELDASVIAATATLVGIDPLLVRLGAFRGL